jgi:hypothetical protein
MKRHDNFEEHDDIHRDAIYSELSLDACLVWKIIVPFYSKDFTLRLRWRSVRITDILDKAPQRIRFHNRSRVRINQSTTYPWKTDGKKTPGRLLHSRKRMQLAAVHLISDRQIFDRHL